MKIMNKPIKIISLSKYPRVFNVDTPFWADLHHYYDINTRGTNMAEFNLICSRRDLKMWTKMSMKPHRGWKVADAKKYFNIKGRGDSLLAEFMKVWDEYYDLKKELTDAIDGGYQIELTT
jgi:hypothetical protein